MQIGERLYRILSRKSESGTGLMREDGSTCALARSPMIVLEAGADDAALRINSCCNWKPNRYGRSGVMRLDLMDLTCGLWRGFSGGNGGVGVVGEVGEVGEGGCTPRCCSRAVSVHP